MAYAIRTVNIHHAVWAPVLLLAACLAACSGESALPTAATTSCAVDNVANATGGGGTFTARTGSKVVFQGWAGDVLADATPERVSVVLVGPGGKLRTVGTGPAKNARPDVAKAFGKPGMANAGFGIEVSLSDLPAGAYEIHLVHFFGDRQLACRSDKALKVQ